MKRKLIRMITVSLAVVTLLGCCMISTSAAAANEIRETTNGIDCSKSAWYYNAVIKGLCYGYLEFHNKNDSKNTLTKSYIDPTMDITRGEFFKAIYAFCKEPTCSYTKNDNPFSDLSTSSEYFQSAIWCYKNGLCAGVPKNGKLKFCGSRSLTRAESAVILYSLKHCDKTSKFVSGYDTAVPKTSLDTGVFTLYNGNKSTKIQFYDWENSNSVASWSRTAIAWAIQNKVISGTLEKGEHYVCGNGTTTRAMAAQMLVAFTPSSRTLRNYSYVERSLNSCDKRDQFAMVVEFYRDYLRYHDKNNTYPYSGAPSAWCAHSIYTAGARIGLVGSGLPFCEDTDSVGTIVSYAKNNKNGMTYLSKPSQYDPAKSSFKPKAGDFYIAGNNDHVGLVLYYDQATNKVCILEGNSTANWTTQDDGDDGRFTINVYGMNSALWNSTYITAYVRPAYS